MRASYARPKTPVLALPEILNYSVVATLDIVRPLAQQFTHAMLLRSD